VETKPHRSSVLSRLVLHPFLFALYPVFAQYAVNTGDIGVADLVRPATTVLLVAGVFVLAARVTTRHWTKAGVLASILILGLFVLWGTFVKDLFLRVSDLYDVKVRYLFLAYAGIVGAALLVVALLRREGQSATKFLNVVAGALVVMSLGQAVMHLGAAPAPAPSAEAVKQTASPVEQVSLPAAVSSAGRLPDVYFIVLDGYLRADALKEYYDFDNAPFLDAMRQRGFFVAEQSHTNYDYTTRSLPACLSMDFLEHIAAEHGLDDIDQLSTFDLYKNARVHDWFRGFGYLLASFTTGFRFTDPGSEFDIVMTYRAPWWEPTRFEILLLDFTPFLRILRYAGVDFGHAEWYRRLMFNLEHMHTPAAEHPDQPVYVQAHIVAPHPPFVLRADGAMAEPAGVFSLVAAPDVSQSPRALARLYIEQIQGLNQHVLRMVDTIMSTAQVPPVIAVVSDHGVDYLGNPSMRCNITLLYLPGVDQTTLPHDLNLVHVFPLILNRVFGQNVPMPPEPPPIDSHSKWRPDETAIEQ